MGSWLLLGTDSLIACIAAGPIMSRRLSVLVPFALLFGVGDGLGYLLGCALSRARCQRDVCRWLVPLIADQLEAEH